MSIVLLIDSSSTVPAPTRTDNFLTYLNPPIDLGKEKWKVALIEANLWYSWNNISAEKANNTLRYHNGVDWATITIPDGLYTLEEMNDYIQDVMYANGDYTVDPYGNLEFSITFEPNGSTRRTTIIILGSYQLDLTVSDLYLLLGWDSDIYTSADSGDGQSLANINDSINNLVIHCDQLNNSFTYRANSRADVLAVLTPDVNSGENIVFRPVNPIYLHIDPRENQLSEIRMYIIDNLGRSLNLNGEPTSYLLHFKQRRR